MWPGGGDYYRGAAVMDMPDKLELIAHAIRAGRKVECRRNSGEWWGKADRINQNSTQVFESYEYRIAPNKPLVINPSAISSMNSDYEYVQLTPEVRQALADAGIET